MGVLSKRIAASAAVIILAGATLCFAALIVPVCADTTIPTLPTVNPSDWQITEDQAIAISSSYVPPAIVARATIASGREMWSNYNTCESRVGWMVAFMNISVMPEELG